MPILKLDHNDLERELDFEIKYQATLTTAQRFEMMERESRRILEKMIENGEKKPFEIIKHE